MTDHDHALKMCEGPGGQPQPFANAANDHQDCTPEMVTEPATSASAKEQWEDFKNRVRASNRLEDVVGENAAVESRGGSLICSSPLRTGGDTDPSFCIDPEKQLWIDRGMGGGVGVGGDVFRYVELRDNVGFRDALLILARRVGIQAPNATPQTEEQIAFDEERRDVEVTLTDAAVTYHQALPPDVRKFLKSHYGFTDDLIDREKIGYDPGGTYLWSALKGKGCSDEALFRTGLFVEGSAQLGRSRFHHRITMPYWYRGSVVYFCARATKGTPKLPKRDKDGTVAKNPDGSDRLLDPPKYLKLKVHDDKPLFECEEFKIHSSVSRTISNGWFAGEDVCDRKLNVLVIAEGMPDFYSVKQAGYAVISPVTIRFRREDQPKLLRLSSRAGKVVIVPDQERSGAGMSGAKETGLTMCQAGLAARIAILPHEDLKAKAEADLKAKRERGEEITTEDGNWKIDANEYLRDHPDGVEFRQILEQAVPLIQFMIEAIPETAAGRDLDVHLGPVLKLVARCDRLERDSYVDRIVTRWGVKRPTITGMLDEIVKKRAADATPDEPEESSASFLVGILRGMTMAKTSTGRVFGELGTEALPADSRTFLARVAGKYHAATGRLLPKETLQNAVAVVLGDGLPTREMPVRVAGNGERIVIDMADAEGRAIVITASGISVQASPVAFLRPDGTRSLPEPAVPADDRQCQEWLGDFRKLIGAHDAVTWASVVAFQLSSVRPMEVDGELSEYTGLRIKASEGTGKTTFSRLLRSVVDPRDPDVIALPTDTENLAIMAENMHMMAFDNLSDIRDYMSDALCRTCTGEGYLTRSLYTNRELTVFKGSKPVILTSITDVAENADLLDRFLIAKLERPLQRTTKKKVMAAFRSMKAKVLGAVCHLIKAALANVANVVVPDDIRMQEPCAFAMAAEEAAGLAKGSIVDTYRYAKRDGQNIVSSDPMVDALLAYLAPEKYVEPVEDIFLNDPLDDGAFAFPVERNASVGEHLSALTELAYPGGKRIPQKWPTKGRGLRACLDRFIGVLRVQGIIIDFGDRTDREGAAKNRTWTFRRTFLCSVDVSNVSDVSTYRAVSPPMDTSPNQTCPPTCPPNVSTLTIGNQAESRQMDTLDTSISPSLQKEEEAIITVSQPPDEIPSPAVQSYRPSNVSNVSTSTDLAPGEANPMDTWGGHVHGHVADRDVSILYEPRPEGSYALSTRVLAVAPDGWVRLCVLDHESVTPHVIEREFALGDLQTLIEMQATGASLVVVYERGELTGARPSALHETRVSPCKAQAPVSRSPSNEELDDDDDAVREASFRAVYGHGRYDEPTDEDLSPDDLQEDAAACDDLN